MADIKPTKTLVYKTVGQLEIGLDLYLPNGINNVPVLIWFHGGGCLQGSRDLLAPHFRRGVQKYGFACVAADYRLAPQVGIQDILEDVLVSFDKCSIRAMVHGNNIICLMGPLLTQPLQDCLRFVRTQLPSHVNPGQIDVSKLAVSGNSAGGYLTLLAGLYAEPKPDVILPLEPITDPHGQFFTTPQPIPSHYYLASLEELAQYLDPTAEPVSRSEWVPEDPRANLYVRMLNDANLAELLRIPKGGESEKFRVPRQVFECRLPPAYFLHGDADIDVGISQSDEVVGVMLGCGIEVQYERVHGEAHYLANGPEYENEAMYKFMLKHLGGR
jgi:acetyl esterase/lipase